MRGVCAELPTLFIVGSDFSFNDGLFWMQPPRREAHDSATWVLEKTAVKTHLQEDMTLAIHSDFPDAEKALFTLHWTKSPTLPVLSENLAVYEIYAATGVPDRAGTGILCFGLFFCS